MYPEWGYAGIPSVFEGKNLGYIVYLVKNLRKYVSVLPEIFLSDKIGKPAEDNDASALSVLCFPRETIRFPKRKRRVLTWKTYGSASGDIKRVEPLNEKLWVGFVILYLSDCINRCDFHTFAEIDIKL